MINRNLSKLLVFSAQIVFLASCTNTDEVVFVTKSSLSIVDVESTPASITLGYDRVEGYFAPAYDNGSVPPVVSSIQTDGGLFAPKIKQLYATGEAANIVLDHDSDYNYSEGKQLSGDKKGMFFGTSTNLGFKIGITQENPSLNIGYKRIEASYIPLGNINGVDVYPSVIASIDTTIKAPMGDDINPDGLQVGQYFATGTAAKQLASKGFIKQAFDEKAQDAVQKYRDELNKQQAFALGTLKCAVSLNDSQWEQVIDAASTANLLSGAGEEIEKRWQSYLVDKTVENRQQATKLYFSAITKVDASSPTYAPVLESHKNLVCKLAKEANNV